MLGTKSDKDFYVMRIDTITNAFNAYTLTSKHTYGAPLEIPAMDLKDNTVLGCV